MHRTSFFWPFTLLFKSYMVLILYYCFINADAAKTAKKHTHTHTETHTYTHTHRNTHIHTHTQLPWLAKISRTLCESICRAERSFRYFRCAWKPKTIYTWYFINELNNAWLTYLWVNCCQYILLLIIIINVRSVAFWY